VLSIFFVAVEKNALGVDDTPLPPVLPQAPLRFPEAGTAVLDTCSGNRVPLSPPAGSEGWLKPSRVGAGWTWVNRHGKSGWEFDLLSVRNDNYKPLPSRDEQPQTRRMLVGRAKHIIRAPKNEFKSTHGSKPRAKKPEHKVTKGAPPAPLPPINPIDIDLGPVHYHPNIISFPLTFNETRGPGLVVDYLRSYANYGEAVVWVTKGDTTVETLEASAQDAILSALVNRKFAATCHAIHEYRPDNNNNDANMCAHVAAGSWEDPSIMNGKPAFFWLIRPTPRYLPGR